MDLNELLKKECPLYDDCEIGIVYYFDTAVIIVYENEITIECPNYMEEDEWDNPIVFTYSRENAPMDLITRVIYGV